MEARLYFRSGANSVELSKLQHRVCSTFRSRIRTNSISDASARSRLENSSFAGTDLLRSIVRIAWTQAVVPSGEAASRQFRCNMRVDTTPRCVEHSNLRVLRYTTPKCVSVICTAWKLAVPRTLCDQAEPNPSLLPQLGQPSINKGFEF
nr:hypothetical protein CFP56_07688 [Quercus suber]